jgi:hypothetical protein
MKNYIFVAHKKGQFEGRQYDNVVLSDGMRAFKVKNLTGLDFSGFVEGDKVIPEFQVSAGYKEMPDVRLLGMKKF